MNMLARILVCAAALIAVLAVPPVQAAQLTTQDFIDIEQLYATYNHAIDDGDGEALAATFTPDGSFNRLTGKQAFVGFVNNWREKMDGANRRHWNTSLRITPAAEGAKATVLVMVLDVGAKPPSIVTTGQYTDVLVKTAQGWRFKSRAIKIDAPPATPAKP